MNRNMWELTRHIKPVHYPPHVFYRGFGMHVTYDSYRGMTNNLLLLESHALNGDCRAQIGCLKTLAGFNMGMMDDRVSYSLDRVKRNFAKTCLNSALIMKLVTCLHKFGDTSGLLGMLPYFSYEFAFMPSANVATLARIYAIHCRGSMEFKDFSSKLIAYMRIQLHSFSLDARLSCLLSCSGISESRDLITSGLLSYNEELHNLDAKNIKTLQTVLCALRLHNLTLSNKENIVIPGILERSFNKVLECINTCNIRENRDCINILARICYLLSRMCHGECMLEMPRLLNIVWRLAADCDSKLCTVQSSLYLLYSARLMKYKLPEIKHWLLGQIRTEIPKLTITEMTLLLECIEKDTEDIVLSQFAYTVNDLKPIDFVRVLKIYTMGKSYLPPLFEAQLKTRFCAIWKHMDPNQFSTSFNHLIKMQGFDRDILSIGIRYIYDHCVDMGPKEVGQVFHAFAKVKFYPSRQIIKILHRLVHRDIDHFGLEDLVRCMSFVAPLWRLHTDLFTALLASIIKKLEGDVHPYHICSLAVSLVSYRNGRVNSLLYAVIFAAIKNMTRQQLCLTFKNLAKSGPSSHAMPLKLCHYMIRQRSSFTNQDIDNLMEVVNLCHFGENLHRVIRKCHTLTPVQRFIIEGGDIDLSKLNDFDLLQCIYALRYKPKNTSNDFLAKRLCGEMIKIAPNLTSSVAKRIMDALRGYGYMKPKICRALTNRICDLPDVRQRKFNDSLDMEIPIANRVWPTTHKTA